MRTVSETKVVQVSMKNDEQYVSTQVKRQAVLGTDSALNPDPSTVINDPPTDGAVATGCGISYVYRSLADCHTERHWKTDSTIPRYGIIVRIPPLIALYTEMLANCSLNLQFGSVKEIEFPRICPSSEY
jgi:hypothetical protein